MAGEAHRSSRFEQRLFRIEHAPIPPIFEGVRDFEAHDNVLVMRLGRDSVRNDAIGSQFIATPLDAEALSGALAIAWRSPNLAA